MTSYLNQFARLVVGSITIRCSGNEPAILPRIDSFFLGVDRESCGNRAYSLVGSSVFARVKNIFVDSWTLRTLQILLNPYHANPDITLLMLLEITGNPNVGFNEEDIEGDFDPKKYDEAMQVSNSYKYDIFPIISCFTCGTRKTLLCFWISIIKMSRPSGFFNF